MADTTAVVANQFLQPQTAQEKVEDRDFVYGTQYRRDWRRRKQPKRQTGSEALRSDKGSSTKGSQWM